MNDDLVKRLRDCANGFGNFKNDLGDFGLCDTAANRIEELEAKLKTVEEIGRAFEEDAGQLRAKLAKAVEVLGMAFRYNTAMHGGAGEYNKLIKETLAELTGDKDE
jgi:hypothetical protein